MYLSMPVKMVFLATEISLMFATHSWKPTWIEDYKRPLRTIHVLSWIIEILGVFDNTVYSTYAIQLSVSLDVIVLI